MIISGAEYIYIIAVPAMPFIVCKEGPAPHSAMLFSRAPFHFHVGKAGTVEIMDYKIGIIGTAGFLSEFNKTCSEGIFLA